jgi:hypothetical protein
MLAVLQPHDAFCSAHSSVFRGVDGCTRSLALRAGISEAELAGTKKDSVLDMKMGKTEKDAIVAHVSAWIKEHGKELFGDKQESRLSIGIRAVLRGAVPPPAGAWAASKIGDPGASTASLLGELMASKTRCSLADEKVKQLEHVCHNLRAQVSELQGVASELQLELTETRRHHLEQVASMLYRSL